MDYSFIKRSLPNALTSLRLLLGLGFFFVPPSLRLWVFLLASSTEVVDGYLARLFNVTSLWGKILDPLADKIFFLGMFFTLLYESTLLPSDFILLALREFFILGGMVVLLLRGRTSLLEKLKPRLMGKLTTAFQYLFFLSLFVTGHRLLPILYLTALIGFVAGIDYSVTAWRAYRRVTE